jgi:nucleotide sugar dehydrogenase
MANKIKVGIIGLGMVGEPIRRWFENQGHIRGEDLFLSDTDVSKGFFDNVNYADVIFVSVPTPSKDDGTCNTSIVESVIKEKIEDSKIVVIKSTIPPSTTQYIQNQNPKKFIIFNPEFLTEGQSWADYIHPVRQIVAHTTKSRQYTMIVKNLLPEAVWSVPSATDYRPLMELNSTEAEIVKYSSNLFGAIKVTFANIIFDVCRLASRGFNVNVDWERVRSAIAADPRIGPAWLDVNHGTYRGFGGYCFPKDFMAFMSFIKSNNHGTLYDANVHMSLSILEAIWNYNKTLLCRQSLTVEDVSEHTKNRP